MPTTNFLKSLLFIPIILSVSYIQAQNLNSLIPFKKNNTEAPTAPDVTQLRTDLTSLSAPEMEGRKVGTRGEQLAMAYIERRFQALGLEFFETGYRRNFKFISGQEVSPESRMFIRDKMIKVPDNAYPMPFSPLGTFENYILPGSTEVGSFWALPLYSNLSEANATSFDFEKQVYERALDAQNAGATGVFFYDNFGGKNTKGYTSNTSYPTLNIPVWIITNSAYDASLRDLHTIGYLTATIGFRPIYSDATNIMGFINNRAAKTVIIMSNYDGVGKMSNLESPGSNDNASGVAGMLEVAKQIRKASLTKYNYLFVGFSGGKMKLSGAKKFVEAKNFEPSKIAYIIDLEQIGSLSSQKTLTIGGVGSSLNWKSVLSKVTSGLKLNQLNSGDLQSEYLEFEAKKIPYLYFTTANNAPVEAVDDNITKINFLGLYDVSNFIFNFIKQMEMETAPFFKEPVEPASTNTTASNRYLGNDNKSSKNTGAPVSIGIAPDLKSNDGVLIANVAFKKAGYIAGLKAGDVIIQIGPYPIKNIEDYNSALTKFNVGNQAPIKVKRTNTIRQFYIKFQ